MKHVHAVVAYKNSKTAVAVGDKGPYCVGGLAANAAHTVDVLQALGVDVKLLQVEGYANLLGDLLNMRTPTHVVIEAIWLSTQQIKDMAEAYPHTKFIVRSHSKIGFLQVEPEAVTTIRQIIELRKTHHNVYFSSNNEEFAESMTEAYGLCLYLPNLYDMVKCPERHVTAHAHTIHIASLELRGSLSYTHPLRSLRSKSPSALARS